MSNGFGNGSVSFRVLDAGAGLPDDWQERMSTQPLPGIGELEERVEGWCGWRHALDRIFFDESLKRGGYPTGQLVIATRKVPSSTLDAEVAQEELAVMKAESRDYLNQAMRSEIKNQIKERLLPDMPVEFKPIEWVYSELAGLVFCTATTESNLDRFVLCWQKTFGVALAVLDPERLAERNGFDQQNWPAVAFGQQGELFCSCSGREFLMWLWYSSEKRGGLVNVPEHGEFVYLLEGPLVLTAESKTITVKSGKASMDAETAAALVDGLTLDKCKFILVRGEEVWSCTLDSEFVFRSLKPPPTESFNIHDKFSERVSLLVVFRAAFVHLFDEYCTDRESKDWKTTVRRLNDWIDEKRTNHERSSALKFLSEQNIEVSVETSESETPEKNNLAVDAQGDEGLVEQAIEGIRKTKCASTSGLQRRLRIGYTRASRLMDILEERKIVGPTDGSKPREILIEVD